MKVLQKLTRLRTLFLVEMLALGAVVVIAQAVQSSIRFEAESGALSGQATAASDSLASSGQYVGFTSVLPSGSQFFEDFKTDQRNRFDWQLQTTNEPPQNSFLGEHNTATPCGSATTFRTVRPPALQTGVTHTKVDATNSELVWWCAENNDSAKGHIMTGLNTDSITALAFSPKQVFSNVKKVCWDQSMLNYGTGMWLNMFIVPDSDVAAHGGDINYVAGASAFRSSNQFLPVGAVDFTWLRGSIDSNKIYPDGTYHEDFNVWMSIDPTDTNGNGIIDAGDTPTQGMATDPEKQFTICVDDASNKVTIERPNGVLDTYDYNIAFPAGQVHVIFQDALKTPWKYVTGDHFTWHWDNIIISSE